MIILRQPNLWKYLIKSFPPFQGIFEENETTPTPLNHETPLLYAVYVDGYVYSLYFLAQKKTSNSIFQKLQKILAYLDNWLLMDISCEQYKNLYVILITICYNS